MALIEQERRAREAAEEALRVAAAQQAEHERRLREDPEYARQCALEAKRKEVEARVQAAMREREAEEVCAMKLL